MPWKEWNKVEERLRFVARRLDGEKMANKRTIIEAPYNGQIIGFATPQIVLPGFALFHIALPRPDSNPKL